MGLFGNTFNRLSDDEFLEMFDYDENFEKEQKEKENSSKGTEKNNEDSKE